MKRLFLVASMLTLVLLSVAACGGAPTPVPTLPPPPTLPLRPTITPQPTAPPRPSATSIPPTVAPQATATPLPATGTSAQSSPTPTTGAVAATAIPATLVPPTPSPVISSASPTPAISPGLYVTNLRLDPVQPAHRVNTSMFVSFLNTAPGDQNVRWVVYLYRADNPTRVNSQSPVNQATFRTGAAPEQDSLIKFNLGATSSTCDYFFARVDILDINNKGTDLPGIDGKTFERGFSICN